MLRRPRKASTHHCETSRRGPIALGHCQTGHHRFAITPRRRLCGENCQYYSALKERKMSMRRFIKIGMTRANQILRDKIMNRGSMGVCLCSITFICSLFVSKNCLALISVYISRPISWEALCVQRQPREVVT